MVVDSGGESFTFDCYWCLTKICCQSRLPGSEDCGRSAWSRSRIVGGCFSTERRTYYVSHHHYQPCNLPITNWPLRWRPAALKSNPGHLDSSSQHSNPGWRWPVHLNNWGGGKYELVNGLSNNRLRIILGTELQNHDNWGERNGLKFTSSISFHVHENERI